MEQEPSSGPTILFFSGVRGASVVVAALAILPFVALLDAPLLVDERVLFFEARKWIGLDLLAPFSQSAGGSGTWRPLLVYFYWLDAGAPLWVSHGINLLLHAVLSVLVFHWLRGRIDPRGAMLGACLFAVHGAHVATAGWVAGRADLAMVTLCLVALLCLDRGRPLLCALACAAAILFKETAVILPFFLLAARGMRAGEQSEEKRSGRAVGLGLVSTGIAFVFSIRAAEVAPGYWPQPESLVKGLTMLSVPYLLEVLVPWFRPLAVPWSLPDLVGLVAALPAAAVLLWSAWRFREPGIRLGLLLCALGIAPVVHVLGNDGGQWYLLLPSVGAALAWGAWCSSHRRQMACVALIVVSLCCTVVEAARWSRASDEVGRIVAEAREAAAVLGRDALETPPAQDPRSWPHVGPSFCCGFPYQLFEPLPED